MPAAVQMSELGPPTSGRMQTRCSRPPAQDWDAQDDFSIHQYSTPTVMEDVFEFQIGNYDGVLELLPSTSV